MKKVIVVLLVLLAAVASGWGMLTFHDQQTNVALRNEALSVPRGTLEAQIAECDQQIDELSKKLQTAFHRAEQNGELSQFRRSPNALHVREEMQRLRFQKQVLEQKLKHHKA